MKGEVEVYSEKRKREKERGISERESRSKQHTET